MAETIAQRYELLEEIGSGGMGVVYRRCDAQTEARRNFEQALPSFRALNAVPSITRIESALAGSACLIPH